MLLLWLLNLTGCSNSLQISQLRFQSTYLSRQELSLLLQKFTSSYLSSLLSVFRHFGKFILEFVSLHIELHHISFNCLDRFCALLSLHELRIRCSICSTTIARSLVGKSAPKGWFFRLLWPVNHHFLHRRTLKLILKSFHSLLLTVVISVLAIWLWLSAFCVSLHLSLVASPRWKSDLIFFHPITLHGAPLNFIFLLGLWLPSLILRWAPCNLLFFVLRLAIILLLWTPCYVVFLLVSLWLLSSWTPSNIVFCLLILLPRGECDIFFLVKPSCKALVTGAFWRRILRMILLVWLICPCRPRLCNRRFFFGTPNQ